MCEEFSAALIAARNAMRHPLDEWKGEVEKDALEIAWTTQKKWIAMKEENKNE
jgi:hypothetical protein